MTRTLPFSIILLALAAGVFAGCANTIKVHLVEPEDGKMLFSGDEYTFGLERPGSVVEWDQFSSPSDDKDDAEEVEFEFPDPDDASRIVPAQGYLYVYEVELNDVAELARNDLIVTDEQIRQLKAGSVLTLRGFDPSGITLYRVVIGMKP